MAIERPADEVTFPVAWDRTIFDLSWSLGEGDHVGQHALGSIATLVPPARLTRTKTSGQLTAQLTTSLDEE